ncbi:ABC transporter substrate-binding protein [Paeniglutamicibacter sp. R2-26]|uniref:ABC transporter substrate-binding protein n=1 Tax=Paeniglutamicibacter sp. R2-26 TaxID=3144417 RepID=UPI003EE5F198
MKVSTPNTRTIFRAGLATSTALALSITLGACAQRSNQEAAPSSSFASVENGTMVWGKTLEAIALDPLTSSLGESWDVIGLVYDRLIGLDDDLKPIPSLATSWTEVSPTEYRFEIRTDAKFSNGRPLTTEDVAWTLTKAADVSTGSSWSARSGELKEVIAEDKDTVVVKLAAPNPGFLSALAAVSASIMPSVEIEAGDVDLSKTMLGSGSFMVESHQQDQSWTMVPNPHAWRDAKLGKIDIKIMPDANARIAALADGSIDVASFENPDAPALLAGKPNVAVEVQKRPDFYFLNLNAQGIPELQDERVRLAIAHAINRDEIRDVALGGLGEPTGPVSVGFPEGMPSTVAFDPERSKALLKEAGVSGLSIEILYSDEPYGAVTQVIQKQLEAVGIGTKITDLEEGVWVDRVWGTDPAKMDATISWYAAFGAPTHVLGNWVPKLAPFADGFLPKDPETDETIMRALQATPETAAQTLKDAAAAIDESATVIPLVTKPTTFAYRSDTLDPAFAKVDGMSMPFERIAEFDSGRE